MTERASTLVREEIELAKAEMTEKGTKLAKGAAVGGAAGVFAAAGLIYLLHSLSWLVAELLGADNPWLGFLIVAVVLFVIGAIAGLVAARAFKKGSPPTPAMAIEEGKLIKATVTTPQPATPQASASTEVRT